MSRKWVRQLEVGESVNEVYAVTSVQLKPYSGGEFLSLRLADRTGKVSAIFWEGSQHLFKKIQNGTLLRVQGKVGRYQGSLQLTASSVAPLSEEEKVTESDFLPTSSKDLLVMQEEIKHWRESLEGEVYRNLWTLFLEDEELMKKFSSAPAGKQWHHARLGGLLEHTLSVIELCNRLSEHYPDLNRDLLLTGALFHDVGKAEELIYRTTFDYSDIGRLVGHITLGVQTVRDYVLQIPDFPDEEAMLLQHLILSHQGETPESPRYPRCREALVLHLADEIDSQIDAFTREIEKPESIGLDWTPYVNLINRYLYRSSRDRAKDEGGYRE